MSDITVYAVEDNHGDPVLAYDEPLSLDDARRIARERHGRVVAREFTFSDSYLVDGEDYTRTGGEWYSADDEDGEQRDLAYGLYAEVGPDGEGRWSWEILGGDVTAPVPSLGQGRENTKAEARKAVHKWACENIEDWRLEQDE